MIATKHAPRSDVRGARERLLDTASRLFYSEGVQTVGIDRILEESGVAKSTLYKAFGSKDALVRAYAGEDPHRVRRPGPYIRRTRLQWLRLRRRGRRSCPRQQHRRRRR